MLNVIIALLIFGFLILIHELGHYTMARVFKVGINEFSVGMGPKVVSKKSKKTGIAYSLRLLPIGGFVSMDGEDEDSGSENSLSSKPVWQRFFIMVAGAVMNILVGIVLTCVIVCRSQALGSTVVASFSENASSQTAGLAEGDRIVKIGKHGVTRRMICRILSCTPRRKRPISPLYAAGRRSLFPVLSSRPRPRAV